MDGYSEASCPEEMDATYAAHAAPPSTAYVGLPSATLVSNLLRLDPGEAPITYLAYGAEEEAVALPELAEGARTPIGPPLSPTREPFPPRERVPVRVRRQFRRPV